MFTSATNIIKLALSAAFFFGGIILTNINLFAVGNIKDVQDFFGFAIFLVGSIGMVVIGFNGFKEVKNTPKPGVLTIYLPAK